jgi:UDP-N-acetylmuramate dehydrogenase
MRMRADPVRLSDCTTLRLGGPAERLVEAETADDVVAVVREADQRAEPLLVLGGGSNLVVADEGFPGTVALMATSGITVTTVPGIGERVLVTVAAGEDWDRLVEWTVAEKLAGLECLAGIPGLAGATPIQNVGAYGQEVSTVIESVRVLDRATSQVATLTRAECGFGYRTSAFKAAAYRPPGGTGPTGDTGRYVVLDVCFGLERDPMSVPVRYAELAAKLGVATGERAPLAEVRDAVLQLRKGKGMVLDPQDPDTASAGSFFTNPVLDSGQLAELERSVTARSPGVTVPTFPAPGGQVKVPAAWLIERAGFGRGYPGAGAARISSKHTLALTNRGGASTAELLELARQIVAGVRSAFGVELTNEPVLVGVRL